MNYIERKLAPTRSEKAALQEKRNALNRKISKWREIQLVYMPGLPQLQEDSTEESDPLTATDPLAATDQPELAKLWLPSELPADKRDGACIRGVVNKEQRLRFAQIQDALVELRRARRVNRGVYTHFRINVAGAGQRESTRSRTILKNSQGRIDRAARRYNACRASLLKLDPDGAWAQDYKILTEGDNKGPGRGREDGPTGQGDYQPSWIWTVPAHAANRSNATSSQEQVTEDYQAAMRIDWARTVARAERWEEEFELLAVEMVRTLTFLEWKALDWENAGDRRTAVEGGLQHGLKAYAKKQAAVYRNLGTTFYSKWLAVLDRLDLNFELPGFTPTTTNNPATAPGLPLSTSSPSGHTGQRAPRPTTLTMGPGDLQAMPVDSESEGEADESSPSDWHDDEELEAPQEDSDSDAMDWS